MSDVIPYICEDCWFEVLKNLPVKTLGKCRCVCKSWHSLIIYPSFMIAHHKNYTQNEANSLLLYRQDVYNNPEIGGNDEEQFIFFAEGDATGEVCHNSTFPWTRRSEDDLRTWLHFVGSVYGLVCLADDARISHTSRVWIWNPLLRKAVNLPESAAASNVMGEVSSVLGFGYDGKKNDHRLVKISSGRGKEGSEKASPFVEVYSVQEQTWRGISADYFVDNCIDPIHKVNSAQCFLNGFIHWLTWEDENCSHLGKGLLLFDVQEEKFGRMELPKALVGLQTGKYGVFEYQSMLSVSWCQYLYLASGDMVCGCQIWVKGEYSVGSSWNLIWNVLLCDSTPARPITYLGRNGEVLGFAQQSTGELVAYNCKTGLAKRLGFHLRGSTKFSAYMESLVLLDYKTDISTPSTTPFEFQRPVSILPVWKRHLSTTASMLSLALKISLACLTTKDLTVLVLKTIRLHCPFKRAAFSFRKQINCALFKFK